MISIPGTLNTRADYERALAKALLGEQPASEVLPHFVGLCENRFSYQFDKDLAKDEQADGDAPEYIVLADEDGSRKQLKRKEMKNAPIFALGYTVKQVNSIIKDLEALQ